MKTHLLRTSFFVVLLPVSIGCAATGTREPVVFPGSTNASAAQMRADRSECMAMASEYDSDRAGYSDTVKSGAIGAGVGAGTGALAGVITKGKVGRATAAGAAVGGVLGVLKGLYDRNQTTNPSYEQFVEHCLERKGYEIAGWGNGQG